MVELEQLAERRYFAEVPFPGDSEPTLRLSGNGVLVDGEPLHPQAPPPRLGEHNDDLEQLLQRWKAATVVGRVTR